MRLALTFALAGTSTGPCGLLRGGIVKHGRGKSQAAANIA